MARPSPQRPALLAGEGRGEERGAFGLPTALRALARTRGWVVAIALLAGCGKSGSDLVADRFEEMSKSGEPAGGPRPKAEAPRCARCGAQAAAAHVCGRTRYCPGCGRDAGAGHVCGRSEFCATCQRETGEQHHCGVTEICTRPACIQQARVIEGGPGHSCGRTTVCATCRVDGGIHHRCARSTWFCPRCDVEATQAHVCGSSRFCPRCEQEASLVRFRVFPLPVPGHDCRRTRWCRTCRTELAVTHTH